MLELYDKLLHAHNFKQEPDHHQGDFANRSQDLLFAKGVHGNNDGFPLTANSLQEEVNC